MLCAYKLHASGDSPLYRLVGQLGMPWWMGPMMLAASIYVAIKLIMRAAEQARWLLEEICTFMEIPFPKIKRSRLCNLFCPAVSGTLSK